jgi:hypothetical protein
MALSSHQETKKPSRRRSYGDFNRQWKQGGRTLDKLR